MNEMIERAAKAMREARYEWRNRGYEPSVGIPEGLLVRAVIEAIREPIEAMGWAMLAARTHLNRKDGERAFTDDKADKIGIGDQYAANPSKWCMPEWRAAVDAILEDTPDAEIASRRP